MNDSLQNDLLSTGQTIVMNLRNISQRCYQGVVTSNDLFDRTRASQTLWDLLPSNYNIHFLLKSPTIAEESLRKRTMVNVSNSVAVTSADDLTFAEQSEKLYDSLVAKEAFGDITAEETEQLEDLQRARDERRLNPEQIRKMTEYGTALRQLVDAFQKYANACSPDKERSSE
jgi:hypothetical protein